MTTDNNGAPSNGHTPLTPPPAQQQTPPVATAPPASGQPGPGRSSGTTAILVVTAVVGGLALLGAGGTAAAAAASSVISSSRPDSVRTVDVDGITGIDLDADASSVRVEFGDVEEAEFAVTNARGTDWTFERDGDELLVRSPRGAFGWWFGNWFGDEEIVVITLPESLQDSGLDADLTLNAGTLDVAGDFGALGVNVNAGALNVEGSADTLDAQMNAGRADIMLDSVAEADLEISAGDLTVTLTGSAPTRTGIDANAGSVDLTLPDEEYSISQDVSAGTLDATVDQASSARRTIEVSLSAGTVTIRPGR